MVSKNTRTWMELKTIPDLTEEASVDGERSCLGILFE